MVTNEAVCQSGSAVILHCTRSEKHLTHHPDSVQSHPHISVFFLQFKAHSVKQSLRGTEGLLPQEQVNRGERLFNRHELCAALSERQYYAAL